MESEFLKIMDERRNTRCLIQNKQNLIQALMFGSIVEIENILCEKYQATFSSENDSVEKCRQIINICLEKKIDINFERRKYNALLHFVIKHLDEDFKSVINKCEDFDVNGLMHSTAMSLLHLAIEGKKQNVVQILIEFGADVDVKDGCQKTPLFYAVESKQIEIAEMLLKAGANVNAKDHEDMMPINFAFGERDETSGNEKYKPSKLVKLLCSYGADLNFKNENGNMTLLSVCKNGNFKEIEFLIARGADLFSTDVDDKTALHYAALGFNYNLVDFLLRSGFDMNDKYLFNGSLVHTLANFSRDIYMVLNLLAGDRNTNNVLSEAHYNDIKESANMVEFLADNGADINTFMHERYTPLLSSVQSNYLEITECLLELKAKIHKKLFKSYYYCSYPNIHVNPKLYCNKITSWVLLTAFLALKNINFNDFRFTRENFEWVKSFFEECKQEVMKMQERRIWADREVSFFDFLNEDLLKVTKYFRNDDVMSVLESEKYHEFSNYKFLFEKRIERVQKMKNCLNVFLCFLEEFFEGNLPILAFDKIISYLTAGNLRNIGRALCITEESPNGKYFVVHEK
ncbi:putative ankyrin repeat protein RF_0381 [Leptopilina heterotoma]|uniref:putative ankyrin repeat protein RF_0381 n=1 Tax=Leptopilina heterotoma TaxID=63436 RepID=UPI001CA97AC3|nr:putative ankyrin repeat protein RF_0381 [Leptopilina heterotoma]